MSRRWRLAPLLPLVVLAALAWWWHGRSPKSPPSPSGPPWLAKIDPTTLETRPNILMVVYDARRRDDFSFGPHGNQRGDTPFLASFAEDAVFFEDAVSPGCWTVPVHAAMFSGLSVCELGNDLYSPGFQGFDGRVLSLAEILRLAGYRTIAFLDHPYFYQANRDNSLIRGFEHFDVINDFDMYASRSTFHAEGPEARLLWRFKGMSDLELSTVVDQFGAFRKGELRFDLERDADHDPGSGLYLPRLYEMYRQSPYFARRYAGLRDVLGAGSDEPYFLFLNLHMTTIAMPDPRLYHRWFARALMMNAQALDRSPGLAPADAEIGEALEGAFRRLGLSHEGFPGPGELMKQVFDNRFYDATFRTMWELLGQLGSSRDTVTIVTSDHGLSFGEHGESLYTHSGGWPHEYLTRVPLLLRHPRGSNAARWHGRYSQKVSLIDLFETVLELGLGRDVFKRATPIHGRSLLQRLEENRFEPVLISECALRPNSYRDWPSMAGYTKAIYAGDDKLVLAPRVVRAGADGFALEGRLPLADATGGPLVRLHELSSDPHEQIDLSAERPGTVARLRGLVGSWTCESSLEDQERAIFDPEALETLRALGYIE